MPDSYPPNIAHLAAKLDAAAAQPLAASLRRLPRDREMVLDAAHVANLSVGFLQILLSAQKTFKHLSVAQPSGEFQSAMIGYGIELPASTVAIEPDVVRQRPEQEQNVPEVVMTKARTILTIDDSRTMRDMLHMALSDSGFTVVQAVDGQDGLAKLAANTVDAIITDINMPKLDGYGVIREVRKDRAYDHTPILVLSTEGEQKSKDIAKDAGATGWIVKPFDPDRLVEVVKQVCA